METLEIILTVVQVIASLALIVVIMLQSGKESGLTSALVGGTADTYMGKNKGASLDKMLASATKWIALVWALLTLALSLI
jgi:preprotein translocase subunit SecG